MNGQKTPYLKSFTKLAIFALFAVVLGLVGISSQQARAETLVSGSIIATPDTIDQGESTQIKWNSFNATSISISPGIGSVAPSGSKTVSPSKTTTYTITMSNNDGGYGTGTATVYVNAVTQTCQDPDADNYHTGYPCHYPTPTQTCQDPDANNYHTGYPCRYTQTYSPTVNLTADDTSLDYGQSTTLRWTSTNATSCTASGAWSGSKATGSNRSESTGSLTSTKSYTITCTGSGGSASDSVTVNVTGQPQDDAPTVDLRASDASIDYGDVTTLIWTVAHATSCTASGDWSGSVSASGGSQVVGPLYVNKYYTIRCYNNSGQSATDSVAVTVGGNDDGDNQKPDVTTRSATDIDDEEATLRGEVDGNGSSTRVWFEYGRDRNDVEDGDGEETDEISTGSGTDDFDDQIDGLREDTVYYFRAVARNAYGTDYGSVLSFRTDDNNNTTNRECRDTSALNYGGSLPCRYFTPVPTGSAPTVILYADSTSLAYNGATFVRWSAVGATSCQASGGSAGWAGVKSIGPGSFYTGSLSSSRTFTLTCFNNFGSDTDSVTIAVRRPTTGGPTPPPATSLVVINSSIDRNQPIVPTLDNTRPRPGDEITYTVNYQNIGTGSIKNLVLRLDLPYEVVYRYSTPNNPVISGNTLIFNLGTLAANGSGTVTVRVLVRNDAPPGALLNFPATLSYIDPAGYPQTVSANVSAQVWNTDQEVVNTRTSLGAAAFLSGAFWPGSLFGWLLLIILILLLVLLAKHLVSGGDPFTKKTVTTVEHH
ncbi:MAG: hypothetical protein WCT29_02615 [Candidatus Paceibacterota bacterium]|jgi:uncharacterized repeat protein (TIGR01451 family)